MTRARALFAAYVAAVACAAAGAADSHLPKPAKPVDAMTDDQQARYWHRVIGHCRYVASHGRGKPRRSHARCATWARRELDEVRRRLWFVPYPWSALADCESGSTWAYNGPSGFDGGLQFHPGTWAAYRRQFFPMVPLFAWQATPHAQVLVARKVLQLQGWAAWPACSLRLGLR